MTSALLLVPASSHHSGSFMASAFDLRANVYGPANCMIFKMALNDTEGKSWSFLPAITPPAGFSKDFDASLDSAETFITISHIGRIDGPIMAHDPMRQPWPANPDTGLFFLGDDGQLFWRKVGRAKQMKKIILVGCESGESYYQAVANIATITAYGFTREIAAGNPSTVRPFIKTLESTGLTPNGMAKSGTSDLHGGVVHPSVF